MWPSGSSSYFKAGLLAAGLSLFVVPVLKAQTSPEDEAGRGALPTRDSSFVNTADLVVPTAEEIVTDVQSVLFSPRFQRGNIAGFKFVMFPDGSAKVYDNKDRRNVLASMRCTQGVSCLIEGDQPAEVQATGSPKPEMTSMTTAPDVARFLAEWILAGSGTVPEPVVAPDDKVDPATEEADDSAMVGKTGNEAVIAVDNPVIDETLNEKPADQSHSAPPEASDGNAGTGVDASSQDGAPFEGSDCPEQGQFVPTACAEPTQAIARVNAPQLRRTGVAKTKISAVKAEPVVVERPKLAFADKYKLRCSFTGSARLNYENSAGKTQLPGKPRVSLGCSASLTDKLSLRVAVIGYVIPKQQKSYDPDFTYALTYRINDTISLGYSNYSARFSGGDSGFIESLGSGNLRASFRLPKLELPNGKSVACSTSLGLPNPLDSSVNLSCGYSVTKNLRVGATAYLYFPDTQGEYQPDFSYTARYRLNKDWLISYSNYSNNRWPWNPSGSPGSGFGGGSLSLTYSF